MSILVFAGPSLPPECRRGLTGFDWRPPAAAGDLIAQLADPPPTICLIDGYFDARPAPWHKEILLLLEAGSRVLGAASIGALRAAELDCFGMEGVGAIYRAYRDGRLTGDDEVALAHAPEGLGWAPLSEPLVQVRTTLAAAARAGVLSVAVARELREIATNIHFSRRDWGAILEGRAEAPTLLSWLEGGRVPFKQQDALLCLAAAKAPGPPRPEIALGPMTCFIERLAAASPVPRDVPEAAP